VLEYASDEGRDIHVEHIPDMSNGSGSIVSSQQVILVLLLDGVLKAKVLADSTRVEWILCNAEGESDAAIDDGS